MARYSLEDYKKEQTDTWAMVWYGIIIALFAACPGLLIYQTFQWLKLGFWPAITIETWLASNGEATPRVTWVGAQYLLDAALSMPLWLACPILGAVAIAITLAVAGAHAKRPNSN